ncbi:hypothetical protein D3C76_786280 [compost metagenome]
MLARLCGGRTRCCLLRGFPSSVFIARSHVIYYRVPWRCRARIDDRHIQVLRVLHQLFAAVARPRSGIFHAGIVIIDFGCPVLRRYFKQARSMRLQINVVQAGRKPAELRMAPQIADGSRAVQPDVAPFDVHRSAFVAEVEQGNGIRSVPVIGNPHLLIGSHRYGMCRAAGLVDGDDLIVGQQLKAIAVQVG